MITEQTRITVSGVPVDIVRKDIKHLHLAVYPPDGRVRVAAPRRIDDDAIRLAVIARLDWIHRRQRALATQQRQSEREMITGESHYVFGHRFRLDVIEHGVPGVSVNHGDTLELRVRPSTGRDKREQLLHDWYRQQLRQVIPTVIAKWEAILGLTVTEWRIRRMKTRWGSCNAAAGRIWLNLELAKKPPECLEFVVVHEMVHFLERRHNDRFRNHMDRYMPQWRLHRDLLNQYPLAHEDWRY